jgi:hypothetical protein
MKPIDRIIKHYHRGDIEERLNLYLEYPSLREEFTQIDLADTTESDMEDMAHKRRSRSPRIAARLKRGWHLCRIALARW